MILAHQAQAICRQVSWRNASVNLVYSLSRNRDNWCNL
jgi:hypothetical protein